MEESLEETAPAPSPPKKKRGRPKKIGKVPTSQSGATPVIVAKDVSKLRPKKKKGFSKSSAPVSHGKKRQQQQEQQGVSASLQLSQSDGSAAVPAPAAGSGAGTVAEKEESGPADVKLGQSVHGVVDGAFDAGYLVTVRVGDSETVFRGVVFGPGLSLPLNRENDVAPKMKRVPRDEGPDVAASSDSPNEAAISVQAASVTASPHAPPVPVSVPGLSSVPPANEAHRIATMVGSTGMGYQAPASAVPTPAATGSYTSYRSPSFAPGPMPNALGGFYYAPTHGPNPNANHGQGGYYPPRAFPYPFHFPGAEYGGSPQFTGSSASPSPSLPGSLPPRTS